MALSGISAWNFSPVCGREQEREPRRRWRRRDAAGQAQRAEEEAAPTSDDLEMERQLEGEVDLPTAGGGPRCDPVGDDEDEMSICDDFDEAEAGSNTISPAARGEALDDEAPSAAFCSSKKPCWPGGIAKDGNGEASCPALFLFKIVN